MARSAAPTARARAAPPDKRAPLRRASRFSANGGRAAKPYQLGVRYRQGWRSCARDPRIENPAEPVDNEVDCDDDCNRHQHGSLHDWEILIDRGVDDHA